MFHDETWKVETHLFWGQKVKVQVTSHRSIAGVGLCTPVSAGLSSSVYRVVSRYAECDIITLRAQLLQYNDWSAVECGWRYGGASSKTPARTRSRNDAVILLGVVELPASHAAAAAAVAGAYRLRCRTEWLTVDISQQRMTANDITHDGSARPWILSLQPMTAEPVPMGILRRQQWTILPSLLRLLLLLLL